MLRSKYSLVLAVSKMWDVICYTQDKVVLL